MKAVLLISHGSKNPQLVKEVDALLNKLKDLSDIKIFEYGFLEITSPSINEGIDNCILHGATEVIVLLNFLNSGRHVNEDIPRIVDESREKHPNIPITITNPVGQHPNITGLFLDLIKE